jgi:hypothetical protein
MFPPEKSQLYRSRVVDTTVQSNNFLSSSFVAPLDGCNTNYTTPCLNTSEVERIYMVLRWTVSTLSEAEEENQAITSILLTQQLASLWLSGITLLTRKINNQTDS